MIYLRERVERGGWGRGTVHQLAEWVAGQAAPRGFSASILWRLRQFYDTYSGSPKLAPLVRELSWTNNLTILGRAGSEQEREFYLQSAVRGSWSKCELERQKDDSLYKCALIQPAQLSPVLAEHQLVAADIFKESYLLDFLNLPAVHSEHDLQHGLVSHLKAFLMELGRFQLHGRGVPPVGLP